MAKYPSNFNDPSSLSYDTVIERQAVQDNTASTGLASLTQTTEPIGDAIKAVGLLEIEIDNFKKALLHNALPVAVTTTAVLPGTVSYNNGTLGVGATITVADAALGVIDGYTVVAGDRILVKNQAAQAQNGIYEATTLGGGSYTLTRAGDADAGTATELSPGLNVIVRGGTLGGKRLFICTTQTTITVGFTNVIFAEFTSQSQLPIGDESKILSAKVATTNLLPSLALILYSNGTAGVGATLTRGENGLLGAIDGVTPGVGDRILYKDSDNYNNLTAAANATTAVLPSTAAIIYANGASGVGATLTRGENGVLGAIDGVTNIVGDRILVKNQATTFQNGVYTVTAVGSGGAPYVLTRATDADQSAEFTYDLAITVTAGTTNASRKYKYTGNATPTMGTTAISFAQITPIGKYQAGVYTVTSVGSGGTPWVLTRTTDADEASEYASGLSVKIASGTANANIWYKSTSTTVTMGTTDITWAVFTSVNGSRPFPSNAVFPSNERTYFSNLYGSKLKQIQNEAIDMARKLKKMQMYMGQYTNTAGDQTPATNFYPSDKNRGY
jgi:hypothetical protein